VDPAMVPDQKIAPRRSLIAVLGTMLGAMLALVGVLVRHYVTTARTEVSGRSASGVRD